MNRPFELERQIIAALIMRLGLFEADDRLTVAVFSTELNRRIFRALAQAREDGREAPDEVLLSQVAEVSPSELSRITSGCYVPMPENFRLWISRLLTHRAGERLLRLNENTGQQLVKTGEIDADRVQDLREAWREIEALEAGQDEGEPPALTVEDLAVKQIPKIEWLIQPIVERFGYTLVGAQKGVGKSLFVTQLGLYGASGTSPFLTDSIVVPKPVRVLLIQQEVSLAGMQDRLSKMRAERHFDLQERFLQLTTTGAWWNLTRREDYAKLRRLIDKHKPDILILDPLYTFCPRELNTSGDIAPMMEVLSDIKSNYSLGLIVVHHFSNKENADEPQQRTSVGRFMGHSMIANSADTTIGLDFLHPKYRQASLPLPYQNYVCADITSRHGEWPARFAIERRQGCLLFERSSIWADLGRAIIPGQIEDLLEANDGQMLMKDLIRHLSGDARPTTVRRSIDEAIRQGSISKTTLAGKGKPVLLRSVK